MKDNFNQQEKKQAVGKAEPQEKREEKKSGGKTKENQKAGPQGAGKGNGNGRGPQGGAKGKPKGKQPFVRREDLDHPFLPCPLAKKCGGCYGFRKSYEEELKGKENVVRRFCKSYAEVGAIRGMEDPLFYRNKVHRVFGLSQKGYPVCGIYAEGTHDIVEAKACLIEDKLSQRVINTIFSLLRSFKLRTYDEDYGHGFLRHVLVRRAFGTGELMVVLVTASQVFPSKANFVKALCSEYPEITTIVQNVNSLKTNMILGDKQNVLYGKGYIVDELCGRRFRISPKSFYQVNHDQTEVLYGLAVDYAGLTGQETVLDAYCGIGTIGIVASDRCKRILGVENNPEAIRDARINAKENGLTNAEYYCCDAGEFMQNLASKKEEVDVVIMDPPRAGADKAFVESLCRLSPKRVVYISCNPETLGRDLGRLSKHYRIEKITPVDLFAGTNNVETVCLLSQRKPDTTIEVDLDISELEVSSAETKATYEEIKSYVLKKYGLKVSNLYIAQVKRECGIVERINYNLPKTEGNRVPQCPEDKRKAIKDAFIHFQMI